MSSVDKGVDVVKPVVGPESPVAGAPVVDTALQKTFTRNELEAALTGTVKPDSPDNARSALEKLSGEETTSARMTKTEESYIASFALNEQDQKKREQKQQALRSRYEDKSVSKEGMAALVRKFAADRGVNLDEIPAELKKRVFATDVEKMTERALDRLVGEYFDSEKSSRNPEKCRLAREQTKEYLTLIHKAQTEGSLPSDLTAEEVYRLVSENIALLAYQDRMASENTLGDHGIRHLVGHNIRVSMKLADQLAAQGVSISAKDRLVLHQTMIYHDLGYATLPVADAVRREGIKGQDAGHNLLGAKVVKEKSLDDADPIIKIFNGSELEQIHRGVLYHDNDAQGKASIAFNTDRDQTEETKRQNLESIIRTADNTHAFEDKLPELLYRIPETLKIMRLMKTAGEIGDQEGVDKFKGYLTKMVESSSDLSVDDRQALMSAAQSVGADSYKFNVDRICGNKPQYNINEQGQLQITVQTSETHREVAQLFGRDSYKQLAKFIKDLCGVEVNGDLPDIVRSGDQRLEIRKRGIGEKSDYQQAIEDIVMKDEQLRDFLLRDEKTQRQIAVLDREISRQDSPHDKDHLRSLRTRAIEERKKALSVFY